MIDKKAFIIDNGAWNMKCGYALQENADVMPNSIMKSKAEQGKLFTADEVANCRDMSGLFYQLPFQKGFLVNWDIQRNIWDYIFNKKYHVEFESTSLIITEPHFNFQSIQNSLNEIFFEEYQFAGLQRTTSSSLADYKYCMENPERSCIVVDSGFSFTHIIPYYNGMRYKNAITRLDIGGKMMTNYLKDILSYRQLHVLDETYVINQCKEDCCFVTSDFYRDMETCKKRGSDNNILRDYVLPDYLDIKRGYVKGKDENLQGKQIVRLNNERFSVPEMLFSPADIGIRQMGIPECIMHALSKVDFCYQPDLLANVLLIGGNCCLPGIKNRVDSELRQLVETNLNIGVRLPQNPLTYAWKGGQMLAKSVNFAKKVVTRAEYFENGSAYCNEKFDIS